MVVTEQLVAVLAAGLLDGDSVFPYFTSPSVDIFATVAGIGWLMLRLFDFSDADWAGACRHLPADTFIDPGEWEPHSFGVESLFIPVMRPASPIS